MSKFVEGVFLAVFVMLVMALTITFWAILFAFPVKWLWNYAAVGVLGMHVISFWQALALLQLCGLLFRSSSAPQKKE